VRRAAALLVWTGALLFLSAAESAVELHKFDDPGLDVRFRTLTYELRCLVCQNQNIADSNADLAKDLRNVVDRMLRDGKSDEEIKTFMVDRYGEFVLYRPRLRPGTLVLWVGPFLLVAAGVGGLLWHVRRRRGALSGGGTPEAADPELVRIAALLSSRAPEMPSDPNGQDRNELGSR